MFISIFSKFKFNLLRIGKINEKYIKDNLSIIA
jgi:hypothetical protein